MKKIIILCYDFPPLNSIGAQRPFSWFKHFKSFGLYPIIITNNWTNEQDVKNQILKEEEGEVHYVKSSKYTIEKLFSNRKKIGWVTLRKIFSFINSILKFCYSRFDKTYNIYQYSKLYLNKKDVDYILVSGEPFILFKYGYFLSKHNQIQWFADYRDDWIYDHGRLNKGFLDKILKRYESIFEKKYLKTASGFSSVSQYILNDINNRVDCKNSKLVENGVNLNHINKASIILDQNNFNIVYTGRFYESSYMKIFIEGFEKFINSIKNKNIKVYFVGIETSKCTPYYDALLFQKENKAHVKIISSVDVQKAADYQISASILLSFIPGDPSKGIIGAKSYSYASTGKPILLIPEIPNKNSPFFSGRKVQTIAINGNEVFTFLKEKFKDFEKNKILKTDISKEEIERLSRKHNAKIMANWILKTNS